MDSTIRDIRVVFFGILNLRISRVRVRSSRPSRLSSRRANMLTLSVPLVRPILSISSTLRPLACSDRPYFLTAPMNEPAGFSSSALLSATKQYWYDSYGNIRSDGNLVEVIHDAFEDLSYWSGIMPSSKGYSNVMMDTHHYEIFSNDQVALTYPQHISVRRDWIGREVRL